MTGHDHTEDGPTPSIMWGTACLGQCRAHGTDTVMQQNDIPQQYAGMLPHDRGMMVLKGSKTALCTDGNVRVLQCQHQILK